MPCLFSLVFYLVGAISTYRIFRWWKSNRFRLQLSTLMVLTIVTGALIGLNLKPIRIGNEIGWAFPIDPVKDKWMDTWTADPVQVAALREKLFERYWGWPLLAHKPWYWDMDWDSLPVGEVMVLWNFNLVMCLSLMAWTIYFMERKAETGIKTTVLQQPDKI